MINSDAVVRCSVARGGRSSAPRRAAQGSKPFPAAPKTTEDSAASVPVIEPLKSLLAKLQAQSPNGFILQNSGGKPLSLDSLNVRLIAPAMKKAGIEWRGYYPCRRGISSRVTDTSKNALNSTGLLRHSTPITALKHYTRAQKESVEAAMKEIERAALDLRAKETVQ